MKTHGKLFSAALMLTTLLVGLGFGKESSARAPRPRVHVTTRVLPKVYVADVNQIDCSDNRVPLAFQDPGREPFFGIAAVDERTCYRILEQVASQCVALINARVRVTPETRRDSEHSVAYTLIGFDSVRNENCDD
jgi:hypothetical protein